MIETDVVVVGAGPVGLFQVFELGLLELRAELIDSLPHAGGQCSELYPDKPIYDIPALPHCTGRELVERLQKQCEPFAPGLHLGQQVDAVGKRDDGRFDVTTDAGSAFVARAVVVAGGVGSFQARRLKLAGLDRFRGTQLLEDAPASDATAGRRVVVCGNGAAAVDAALAATGAASVTIVHRRDDFEPADVGARAAFEAARAEGRIAFRAGQPTGIETDGDRLAALVVLGDDGADHTVPLDLLLVRLGRSPRLGPIAEWGVALDRKQVVVDTERFETSTPGLFAVGDVNTYPGKRKLIVSGFHEATLAAYAIARSVDLGRAEPTLYTTTSPKLHRLLKVDPPA